MKAIVIVGLVLTTVQAGVRAQEKDPLSAAKDLYASAAYEDALSALSRLNGEAPDTPNLARQVDEYRAFCLYALGRTGEAESIAESMIRKEPLAQLDAADASPRIELMFANVRKRLLPSLIRERFRTARSGIEQKDFVAAEPPLTEARLMIAEAGKLGIKDDGLADLSILVDGFLQLIQSSAAPRAAAPVDAVVSADVPVARPAATATAGRGNATGPAPRQIVDAPPAATPAAAVVAPHVFTVDEEGVTPPVALNQRMPAMTTELVRITKALQSSMILDIIIDETGSVIDTMVRKSLNASFDDLIVHAARRWKYQPATRAGQPVRYAKTLVLVP